MVDQSEGKLFIFLCVISSWDVGVGILNIQMG